MKTVFKAIVISILLSHSLITEAKENPNVIVIMADDMGFGDIQELNPHSRILTPNLNKLAQDGMRFLDAHSPSAVCTPTRYGLVTGRYAWRSKLKRGVLNGYGRSLIDPNRLTVADVLNKAGYRTGIVGKWHLGLNFQRSQPNGPINFSAPVGNTPNVYGFDFSFIIPASLDFPPYVYIQNEKVTELPTEQQKAVPFPAFIRKGERSPSFIMEEVLDKLTEEAVQFVKRNHKKEKPFFLYFPLTSPHKPVLPAKRFVGSSSLGLYGDFIHQTDWTVGQILNVVKDTGIDKNTIIIFTSDNGSFMYRLSDVDEKGHVSDTKTQAYQENEHRSNFIFRGTKADIFEGGHRVPFLVKWPNQIRPGSISKRTTSHVDILATLAEIVDFSIPDGMAEDSFSFLHTLKENAATTRPPVINHSANGTFAIRQGPWKLILSDGSGGREKPSSKPFQKPYQLYNLSNDPRELNNLIDSKAEIARRLEAKTLQIMNKGY